MTKQDNLKMDSLQLQPALILNMPCLERSESLHSKIQVDSEDSAWKGHGCSRPPELAKNIPQNVPNSLAIHLG